MKRSLLALAAFACLLTGTANAHDFWIEPSTFRPAAGENVLMSLRIGEKLRGEPFPVVPVLVDRFVLKGEGAEIPVEAFRGVDPAGYVKVGEPGLHWLGYQSRPFPLALEASKFEESLRREGLERVVEERARKGQASMEGRERFYRCAKALLLTPSSGKDARSEKGVVDARMGFTLELVPRKNPYLLKPGADLPLSLSFRGKPVANVLVTAMCKDDPERIVSARTDAKGLVSLRLAHAGFWLVKAVHMEAAPRDAGVDWESWWASLTFELPR
jgi:uncharacterized GH25 family protein